VGKKENPKGQSKGTSNGKKNKGKFGKKNSIPTSRGSPKRAGEGVLGERYEGVVGGGGCKRGGEGGKRGRPANKKRVPEETRRKPF